MDRVAGTARYTAYPVVHDGDVLGVLPLRIVLDTPRSQWDERLVRDCTLSRDDVLVVHAEDDALEAFAALAEADLHRALVLDDGHLTGFISITDVARLLAAPRPSGPGISAPPE
jgi:CBS domain-containing protein